MYYRPEKIAQLLKETSAQFYREATDKTSMITVTDASVSRDLQYATIYISVFPDEKQGKALSFAQGSTRRLKEYLKQHIALGRIPKVSVEIDKGELHRRRIEELSKDLSQN